MAWTAYLAECLHVLETEKEIESDAVLVELVNLRQVYDRVNDLPLSSAATDDRLPTTTPMVFYLKSLDTQLQNISSKILRDIPANGESILHPPTSNAIRR
jgi:hypothetical protein